VAASPCSAHDDEFSFSKSRGFDFELRIVLGKAAYGAAEPGEVLAATEHVKPGDDAGWYGAWFDLGTRLSGVADGLAAAGHQLSASKAYLRAATYLGVATNAMAALDDDDQLLATFRLHRAAWELFIDHTPRSIERVAIPYEGTTLPGYFFTPDGPPALHPTLIWNNGSDGAISGVLSEGGVGALERGYNVLAFDGPGQGSMLFERSVPFRPDWEAVITPVVDFLLARTDVDPAALALYGVSQGGYWVPRALAFEHRIAAGVADPGVVDVATSWLDNLPKSLIKQLRAGEGKKFDKNMAIGMKFSKGTQRLWNFRARPYQQDGYYDVMQAVTQYALPDDLAASIKTPLLITNPEHEQFWPGQSEQLAALVPGSTLVGFSASEGADFHCQPLGRQLTDQRVFDWLDDTLGRTG
jgi:hypothetical protein